MKFFALFLSGLALLFTVLVTYWIGESYVSRCKYGHCSAYPGLWLMVFFLYIPAIIALFLAKPTKKIASSANFNPKTKQSENERLIIVMLSFLSLSILTLNFFWEIPAVVFYNFISPFIG